MGVDKELNEPLAANDMEAGRARATSDSGGSDYDPDKVATAAKWTFASFVLSNVVGLMFNALHPRKHEAMMEFYAGYMLELSLSLDNLFAFYLVFKYFKVDDEKAVNRVLFYGILGAIILRALMVFLGAAAIHQYRPLLLVCAAALLYSTYQVFFMDEDDDEDIESNPAVAIAQWMIPVSNTYDADKTAFFTTQNGKTEATPLFLVLIVIEFSDVIFAVDSVPAIFGISDDPYVVWCACMCAIMCLRSLYTLIVQYIADLEYMNKAIGLVLFFIAIKLILDLVFHFKISIVISLSFVAGILFSGVILSLLYASDDDDEE
jgi:TerC family integral membrane protein